MIMHLWPQLLNTWCSYKPLLPQWPLQAQISPQLQLSYLRSGKGSSMGRWPVMQFWKLAGGLFLRTAYTGCKGYCKAGPLPEETSYDVWKAWQRNLKQSSPYHSVMQARQCNPVKLCHLHWGDQTGHLPFTAEKLQNLDETPLEHLCRLKQRPTCLNKVFKAFDCYQSILASCKVIRV